MSNLDNGNEGNDWQKPSGLPPQMQNQFGGGNPDPAGFEPSLGQAAAGNQKLIIAAVGVLVLVALMVMGGVTAYLVSSDSEEVVMEQPVEVAPERAVDENAATMDDIKKFAMERASSVDWQYTWKETRDNGLYEAASVVFEKRKMRAGLTIFIADTDTLTGIEDDAGDTDVIMRHEGALLIFTPMPGKALPKSLWGAFQESPPAEEAEEEEAVEFDEEAE